MKLYTQLNFGGNCEEAFHFYEKHLGGKIEMMMGGENSQPSCRRRRDLHADGGDVLRQSLQHAP
jgi:uncharacterized glyoxalase superfamily protein PhnB